MARVLIVGRLEQESMTLTDIPVSISAAFARTPTLPSADICRLLRMDPKTLRQHVRAGNIGYVLKGFGEKRPRREFTQADVLSFLNKRTRGECLFTSRKGRRTSSSTFGGEIVGFTDRHMRPNGAEQKR